MPPQNEELQGTRLLYEMPGLDSEGALFCDICGIGPPWLLEYQHA